MRTQLPPLPRTQLLLSARRWGGAQVVAVPLHGAPPHGKKREGGELHRGDEAEGPDGARKRRRDVAAAAREGGGPGDSAVETKEGPSGDGARRRSRGGARWRRRAGEKERRGPAAVARGGKGEEGPSGGSARGRRRRGPTAAAARAAEGGDARRGGVARRITNADSLSKLLSGTSPALSEEVARSSIADFVTSCCPRQRRFQISGVKGRIKLVLRTEVLEEIDLSYSWDIQELDLTAPNLRVITLDSLDSLPFGVDNDKDRIINRTARIVAPKLEEIDGIFPQWRPSCLYIRGLTRVHVLKSLWLDMHGKHRRRGDVCFWLLENCPGVQHIDVTVASSFLSYGNTHGLDVEAAGFTGTDEEMQLVWLLLQNSSSIKRMALRVEEQAAHKDMKTLLHELKNIPCADKQTIDSLGYALGGIEFTSEVMVNLMQVWAEGLTRNMMKQLSLGSGGLAYARTVLDQKA
ncbi:hypothetical protein PR202_ga21729 [Eleusine coracana subsp. coracana]|uniref:Uncharacterized protein n=1 Tax=Eleusine coracana subsp. coracana TaxID=191504 RepID=A0AAV5D1R0_ELECO|nr:hypothetical protein PR202_ga21729 [Eleusine coracana subsp. coracana]